MLFDLQGKRRRMVQATYLGLAVLMGGGLVLFGIGGDVSGGLFDAFSDRSGGTGNEIVEERIERNEKRLETNPNSAAARKELVRGYYQLAASQTTADDSGGFPSEARDELEAADRNWRAYLATNPEPPDASLARLALQIYDPIGLNRPKLAQEAARIIAERENSASAYLMLVQYATLAGDERMVKLASTKTIDLAPKNQRKDVRKQLQQLKAAAIAQQLQQEGVDIESLQGEGDGGTGGGDGGGGGGASGSGSGGGSGGGSGSGSP